MLNVGIIGFGKMGQIRAKAVEETGTATVVAVYDPTPPETAYETVDDPEKIIAHPDVDAVFICTPNYRNKELTIASLEAGKHVFCEKPPAFTAKEVEEIRAVETASGKKLMYGFNHRHHSSIKEMKRLVDSGVYGKILWMRGRYGKSVDHTFFNDWRSDRKLSGGGILIDQGIHMLDLFLHLGGNFDEISAMVSNLYWRLEDIEDNVFAILRNTKTGVVASLHSTMTQWRHLFSIEVFLDSGYMVLNGLKTSSGTYGQEELAIAKNRTKAPAATWDDEERRIWDVDSSWTSEVSQFCSAILRGEPITSGNSKDALDVMRLIDTIYEHDMHRSENRFSRLQWTEGE